MAEMNDKFNTTFKMKDGEETLKQYCVAVLDTEDAELSTVTNPQLECGNIAGILRDKDHEAGKYASYQVAAIATVKIAEAVSVGDMLVVANSAGLVKPKGTGMYSSPVGILGRAISAAILPNSLVKVILTIPAEYIETKDDLDE